MKFRKSWDPSQDDEPDFDWTSLTAASSPQPAPQPSTRSGISLGGADAPDLDDAIAKIQAQADYFKRQAQHSGQLLAPHANTGLSAQGSATPTLDALLNRAGKTPEQILQEWILAPYTESRRYRLAEPFCAG